MRLKSLFGLIVLSIVFSLVFTLLDFECDIIINEKGKVVVNG